MAPKTPAPEAFDLLWQELDSTGKAVVSYLLEHRYADLDELATYAGVSNHMELLLAIRENINPKAQRVLGFPLLSFAESRYDPASGKKLCFKWWLSEAVIASAGLKTPPRDDVDIFEDGSSITVLIDARGFSPEDISFEVTPEEVAVKVGKPAQSWLRKIPLPAPVLQHPAVSSFNNGILSLSLRKRGCAP